MVEFPQRPHRPFQPIADLLARLPNHVEPTLTTHGGSFWAAPSDPVFQREHFDYHRGAILAGPGIGIRLLLEEEALG